MPDPENKFVKLWQAHANQPESGAPDSVELDDEEFLIPGLRGPTASQPRAPLPESIPSEEDQ